MRGGTAEREFQRSSERSEGDDKAMMVVFPRLRPKEANVTETPWRPGPATVERS
jgi:hypothetical protein